MNTLFGIFPREMATPTRFIAKTKREFYSAVNEKKGRRRIFTGVYDFNPMQNLISLNKIFFDLDGENGIEKTKKLHSWAISNNYKHIIFFSGKGFHVYILTKNYESLQNPKQALYNCHSFIAEQTGLEFGQAKSSDLDRCVRGNTRQTVTIPNTWNNRRQKYCINVTSGDLLSGYTHICEKAKKQNWGFVYYGTDFFDVSRFDCEMKEYMKPMEINSEVVIKLKKEETLKNIPPCIVSWFAEKRVGWDRRGKIILWLRDYGLWREKLNEFFPCMYEECLEIMKKYLSPKEFAHMNSKADWWQAKYLYFENTRNSFPSCENMKAYGDCPLECGICEKRKKGKEGE